MADLIKSGRRCHATAKYKRALTFFTKAMRSCPCSSGTKLDKCTCRNFEKIASQGGSIFKEAVEICPCNVGILFKKCDNPHHIQALDFRAATYEALGKLDQAIKDAEWILELAPRLPDGYLCLGRIARQQKKDEYAWKVYTAGIEASRESAVGSSPKLQELYRAREPLHWRFSRRDLLSLPSELVTQIFLELEYTELFPCLRVCKQWKHTLTSPQHGNLWRDIRFPSYPNRSPRPDEIRRVVPLAGPGGARSIFLSSMTEISQSALTQLLQLSPNLEIFAACKLPWHCSLPSDVKHWNRLRFVIIMAYRDHFHSIPVDHPGGFPKTFLQNAANSLVRLHFRGIPQQWYNGITTSVPHLHNLRILRIDHYGPHDGVPFRIFLLCDAFPRLEQLKIGPDLPHLSPELVGVSPKRWERLWPHLKVLKFDTCYFGDEINYRPLDSPEVDRLAEMTRSTLRYLTCLNRGNSLEHIQFNFPHRNGRCFSSDDHDLLPDFNVTEHSEYRNLKSFNLRTVCMPPDRVRTLLCNAIETNKLTSFDIVFPQGPPTAGERVGDESIRHLQGYEWFRGTSTIHTLGCYDFRFRPDAENDEDLPLPQFLASFPNLRTLCIDSKNYYRPELASVLVAIIKCTHLKTIYTQCYADRMLDRQLRQVARDHGVELIPVIEDWPEEWPIRS